MFRHSFNQRAKTSFSIEPGISVNLEMFKIIIGGGRGVGSGLIPQRLS